jgi:hypothetical protein
MELFGGEVPGGSWVQDGTIQENSQDRSDVSESDAQESVHGCKSIRLKTFKLMKP